jgi:hypothetical protein
MMMMMMMMSTLADFEAFPHRRPQGDFTRVDFREIGRGHYWSVYVGRCGIVPEIWDHSGIQNEDRKPSRSDRN